MRCRRRPFYVVSKTSILVYDLPLVAQAVSKIFTREGPMLNKLVSLTLALVIGGSVAVNPAYASSQEEGRARATAKVKQRIKERGVGENARVEVVLLDGTKLKGYISEAGEDSFVVANGGAPVRVAYSQVRRVKGKGLSTGGKVLMWLGITAGVLLLIDLIVDD